MLRGIGSVVDYVILSKVVNELKPLKSQRLNIYDISTNFEEPREFRTSPAVALKPRSLVIAMAELIGRMGLQ